MDKADIRKQILKLRDAQTPYEMAERSRIIFDKLVNLDEYKEAENILIYASMRSEVRTDEIILDALADGKKVYCPRVTDKNNGQMAFVRIFALEDLIEGYFGIREPDFSDTSETFSYDNSPELRDEITIAIVPGVAFDRNNNRIGYNGGFYDRFLSAHDDVKSIGICYDLQITSDILPVEAHDVPLDMVISD